MDALDYRLISERFNTLEEKLDRLISALQPPVIVRETFRTPQIIGSGATTLIAPPAPPVQESNDGED